MRTTLRIDDRTAQNVRERATAMGLSVNAYIDAAIKEKLVRESEVRDTPPPFRAVTYGSGGTRPGVDLDDSAMLLDLMDE